MDFWRRIGRLLLRWDVGVPVAAVALIAAIAGFFLAPTHYVSRAYLVLTTSVAGGTAEINPQEGPGLTNPLLQFNDSLHTTAAILIQAAATKASMRELGVVEDGPTELVINDGSTNPDLLDTNGPFIFIEADSTSAAAAKDVVGRTAQRVRDDLAARQQALGAPPETFIGVTDVVPPSESEAQMAPKWQAGALVFMVAFAAGLAGAYGRERVRTPRPNEDDLEAGSETKQETGPETGPETAKEERDTDEPVPVPALTDR